MSGWSTCVCVCVWEGGILLHWADLQGQGQGHTPFPPEAEVTWTNQRNTAELHSLQPGCEIKIRIPDGVNEDLWKQMQIVCA